MGSCEVINSVSSAVPEGRGRRSRLDRESAADVIRRWSSGEAALGIARSLGVSRYVVDRVLCGKGGCWRDLADLRSSLSPRRRNQSLRTTPEPAPIPGARWVPLTKGRFALVDETHHEEVSRLTWRADTTGATGLTYARAYVKKAPREYGNVSLHAFVWALLGRPRADRIDHKSGDGLDCRSSNLRAATASQNQQNKPAELGTVTGLKGVSRSSKSRWRAAISVHGKRIHLGSFVTPVDAARAYDLAALEHFGEFARINYPEDTAECALRARGRRVAS